MRNTPFDERANAYLDGEMTAAEIAAFEAQMKADPSLAEAVADVRTAEEGLRELFAVQGEAPDPLAVEARAAVRAPRRWMVPAAAAALLIAAAGAWYLTRPGPSGPVPSDRFIYRMVTANFTPAVVCDTPSKFAAYTDEAMNETIGADFASASNLGVSLVGWTVLGASYDDERAEDLPRLLLALAPDGTEVVVYFRERGHDAPEHDQSARDPIGVFSKKLGRVTAYEISPLSEPVVLGLLSVDD